MKKFLIFLAGFISGAVFMMVIGYAVANRNDDPMNIYGLTMFEQPADVISSSSFKVMQVGPGGNALAHAVNERGSYIGGMLVLLLADENTYYYDDQVIKVTGEEHAYQVGTYKYLTNNGDYKTVPAVMIF